MFVHADLETQEILPVILVLIEGGINALKTAKRILSQENHVVVIGGSGGAADFLVTYYCRKSSMSRLVDLTFSFFHDKKTLNIQIQHIN